MKYTKVSDYTPDMENANAHSERGVGMLETSIAQTGLGRSIVVDTNGIILAGNSTQERAIDQGFEDAIEVETDGNQLVVVRRKDLDLMNDPDYRARLHSILDNRAAETGIVWEPEVLESYRLQGVPLDKAWTPVELDGLGVGQGEPTPDPGAQLDKAEELQQKWNVQRGDLWVIGEHRLLCGDSTSAEDVARVMGGELCVLVVTDPPYGVEYADKNKFLNTISRGNHIQTPIQGDHQTENETQELWRLSFKQTSHAMAAGAVIYCFMPQGGDQMMMMMMMMGAGIEPRHELIWLKNNHVLGRVDYAYKHEPILYAWKDGGHKFYGDFQTSVIECDKPMKSDLHPTTKPVELIERLIKNSSQINETVFDPFLGSGTTMVAAHQLGRKCYGLEIEPKYCAVALERLSQMGLEARRVE